MRKLLFSFKLPGEAQKIDRIIEKFAEKYMTDNPDSYATANEAYLLSYSIMMLQTSLHNPQVSILLEQNDDADI